MSKSSCNLANDLASILDISTDLADIVISSRSEVFVSFRIQSHKLVGVVDYLVRCGQ